MMPADAVDALIRAAHHVGRGDGEISAVIEAREVVLKLIAMPRNNPHRGAAVTLCHVMAEWRRREPICTAPPIANRDRGGVLDLAEAAVRQYDPLWGLRTATDTPWQAWDSAATLLAGGWRP